MVRGPEVLPLLLLFRGDNILLHVGARKALIAGSGTVV